MKDEPPAPVVNASPRRITPAEQRLARRLEQYTAEHNQRSGGEAWSELGMQLRAFHVRAAKEQTATERQALNIELDAWKQKLETLFPR
ncbi:hypothetical protein D7V88_41325 [Corallococcus terminator]|uniref:Uncharacterized protein n=1 Tax=Corallococcus terminator TaxID=2316733 RepID=A0A3A8H730_9BACT|nr:hypothetical protein D7V88_41325 [Corallococcus terminator]